MQWGSFVRYQAPVDPGAQSGSLAWLTAANSHDGRLYLFKYYLEKRDVTLVGWAALDDIAGASSEPKYFEGGGIVSGSTGYWIGVAEARLGEVHLRNLQSNQSLVLDCYDDRREVKEPPGPAYFEGFASDGNTIVVSSREGGIWVFVISKNRARLLRHFRLRGLGHAQDVAWRREWFVAGELAVADNQSVAFFSGFCLNWLGAMLMVIYDEHEPWGNCLVLADLLWLGWALMKSTRRGMNLKGQ